MELGGGRAFWLDCCAGSIRSLGWLAGTHVLPRVMSAVAHAGAASAHFRACEAELPARVTRRRILPKKHSDQRALDGESAPLRQRDGGLVRVRDVPINHLAGVLRDERFHESEASFRRICYYRPYIQSL